MNPSLNMKAVLVLAEHKYLGMILRPALNIERDKIDWDLLGYHGQSSGVQAALSWAYCLFCDEVPPKDWNYRDPFGGFFSLDRDLQALALKAIAIRHGFLDLSVEDRPKSNLQILAEEFGKKMEEEERRKGLKIVGSKFRHGLHGDADELLRKARNGAIVSKKEVASLERRYNQGELNGEDLDVHSQVQKSLQELKSFINI